MTIPGATPNLSRPPAMVLAMATVAYRQLINRDLPIRGRACESKAVYLSRGEARQYLRSGRRMDRAVKPYRCPFCSRWHLGHRRRTQGGP
jgi:hypothetical protein